ncbi:MAG: hypothetical protein JKY23_04655 [Nitrospinaceae bacterium]|nr:hypothetical protein [Nitrospinaceae bacterium]
MSWREDTQLRDLDDEVLIEATCIRCLHTWLQSPTALLLKVDHRDVYLEEVAVNLSCPKPGCRHVGVRLEVIRNEDTSGFVGGMP